MSGDSTPNHKDSLNLPTTDFPMRGGLATKEPELLERWAKEGLTGQILARRQGAEPFILHDGPPYANGHIHHGHILNKVLKDFVVKYRTMKGHWSLLVPGWDCHGLPIEHQVDKELGDKKATMSQVEIRRACRAYAEQYVAIQRDEFARLGIFAAWDDPYTTMSYQYESQTVRELGRVFDSGAVHKGLKPVHWSWAAETALADAEVEYKAFTAPSIYVKFALEAPPTFLAEAAGSRPIFVVIWTTTPWTLPANLAIALNPDFEYELVGVNGECSHAGEAFVLAAGLKAQMLAECRIPLVDTEVLHTFSGAELVGTHPGDAPRHVARHPFIDRDSVLLPAPYVTLEQGTGCVHTAPGHGQEDFQLCREFGIDVLNPVDTRGRYTHRFEPMLGVHVFDANPKVIALLTEKNALVSSPKLQVTIERYPHCWRTKTPVIFRATEQWFVAMDTPLFGTDETLRQRALREIDRVSWVPSWGKERILGMMENRPDWCISRQRLWGVPITVFYCEACDHAIASGDVARHVADLALEHGSDVWFERDAAGLVPEGFTCPGCGAGPDRFRKETDILDVWFDSGVSWAAVLGAKLGLQEVADLYLEGSDQHRGWFNSSLLTSATTRDRAPYKTVLTHGFVMDEQGRKYSKSSRNFVPPAQMINVDGAEILRLWVAAVDYRGDITLSPAILKTVKDAYRKIRNTWRFLLGTLSDFDPNVHATSADAYDALDRWALSRTQHLIARVRDSYESYEFHAIYHTIVRYATIELSNMYLNVLKDRLYANAVDDPRRRASQTALYEILHSLVRLLAPILAFTSEEVWEHMPHRASDPWSVHLTDLPEPDAALIDDALEERFDAVLAVGGEVARQIEGLRPSKKGEKSEGQIGASEEADVTITASGKEIEVLRAYAALLPEVFIIARAELVEGTVPPEGAEARVAPVLVSVKPSPWGKCARCWRYVEDVNHPGHREGVCARCSGVLDGL